MVWLGEREEGKKIGLEVRSWKVMSACVLCLGFRVSGFDLKIVRIVEGFERRLQCLERHQGPLQKCRGSSDGGACTEPLQVEDAGWAPPDSEGP